MADTNPKDAEKKNQASIPAGAENSSAGKAGAPASEAGTPPRAPDAPPPELQEHQVRDGGQPGAEAPMVNAKPAQGYNSTAASAANPAAVNQAQQQQQQQQQQQGDKK